MDALLNALQFLSRIPVSTQHWATPEVLGRSVLWYPAVGLLLGGLLLLVQLLLQWMAISSALQAVLLLMVWVIFTGGLHLDGLADSTDAWVGGLGSPERTLSIMKDPRCGAMAVVSVVLVLLAKFAALQSLSPCGLLLAPWIARACLPALLCTTDYVRPAGLGAVLVAHLPRAQIPVWLLGHVLLMLVLGGLTALVALAVAAGVFFWTRYSMQRRLGGTTGDTAGALVELSECAVVLVLAGTGL